MTTRVLLEFERELFDFSEEELEAIAEDRWVRRGLVSVLKGIQLFGVTKPQVAGAPFLVVWNFTNACNLNCKHCYQDAGSSMPRELSTEEARDIVDQIARAGVVAVSFSGGEPLVRSDFFEVAEYAYSRGLHVSLATNGTLIDYSVAQRLKRSGVKYVDVSLDGASPETHDAFRGMPGSFERAIRGLKACIKAGLYTCVAMAVTKHNLSELKAMIDLSKKLGAKRFILFNFVPAGRGKEIEELDLTPEEREEALKLLYRELLNKALTGAGIECFATAPQLARVALQMSHDQSVLPLAHYGGISGREAVLAEFIGGCGAGRLYCGIAPDGKMMPCVFMPIEVGDLRQEEFEKIWTTSKVLNDLRNRDLLKGRCGRCPYRFVCGGCRARAYGYFGDYLAPDPGCIREREEPAAPSA